MDAASAFGPSYEESTLSPQGAVGQQLSQVKLAEQKMNLADRVRQQQFWQKMSSGGAPAGGTSPPPTPGSASPAATGFSGQLISYGNEMLKSGLAKPGIEMLTKGVELAGHEATQATSAARRELYQLQASKYYAQELGAHAGTVSDQASYDAFRQWAEENKRVPQGALPDLYADAKPKLELAKSGSMTYTQQVDEKIKALGLAEKKRLDDSTIAHRNFLDSFDNFRKKEEIKAEVKQGKTVGKAVGAPSKQEVLQASGMIQNAMFPGFTLGDDADSLSLAKTIDTGARAIASDARKLMQQNRGLDYDTALQQALSKSVKDGDWTMAKKAAGVFSQAKTSASFDNQGKSAETAGILPPDRSAWKTGHWYVNPKGQVAQWTGKGFELPAAAGDNAADEEEEE